MLSKHRHASIQEWLIMLGLSNHAMRCKLALLKPVLSLQPFLGLIQGKVEDEEEDGATSKLTLDL